MTLNEAKVVCISLSGEFTERNDVILESIIACLGKGFPDFMWTIDQSIGKNPYRVVSVKGI